MANSWERQQEITNLDIFNTANRSYSVFDFDFPMSVKISGQEITANELASDPKEAATHLTHLIWTELRRGNPVVIDDRATQSVYAAHKPRSRAEDNHTLTLSRYGRFDLMRGLPNRSVTIHRPRIDIGFEGTCFSLSVINQAIEQEAKKRGENGVVPSAHIATISRDLVQPVDWRKNSGSFTIATPEYPLFGRVFPSGYTTPLIGESQPAAWIIRGALSNPKK